MSGNLTVLREAERRLDSCCTAEAAGTPAAGSFLRPCVLHSEHRGRLFAPRPAPHRVRSLQPWRGASAFSACRCACAASSAAGAACTTSSASRIFFAGLAFGCAGDARLVHGYHGYPYCIPLLYIWMDGEGPVHTTSARVTSEQTSDASQGFALRSMSPMKCSTMAALNANSGLAYRSVILFGKIQDC